MNAGCATSRAADPPKPCPLWTEQADVQMGELEGDLAIWVGRMVADYCPYIDALRE